MIPTDPDFEALLIYLKESRGFDFTGYKRSSLMRRVDRRIGQIGGAGYLDYLDHLQVHPDEFTALFNTILINVTGFFRDPDAWEHLRAEILPPLLESRPPEVPIRIWSAGCASGEEAYTLAILLAEQLGINAFRDRVKIYATDVDEEQLAEARQAAYDEQALRAVPADLTEKYFERSGDRFTFRKDLRRSVIFGRNDLVQDAPISRIDLLACRNTLMYFNAETQTRILSRFHFALADSGILLLGKAEMLLSHGTIFAPVDLKRRIFRRVPRAAHQNGAVFAEALPTAGPPAGLDQLRTEAFAAGPVAQLTITAEGMVALANTRLETLFGVSARDIGRPFRDLDLSYRPVELRRYVEQAQVERRALRVGDVEYLRAGEAIHLEIEFNPLTTSGGSLLGVNVVFHDVTAARRLRDDLEQAHQQLEAAYEELQSTNEELETTNEELQSTVEELETTNEELQSTNEELETMNEELQSTNEELQNINDQLRISTAQLDDANTFLETVLAGLRAGVVVVDHDLRIRVWSGRAEELWGVRSHEAVGQHFLNLDIGLPFERLRPLLRGALGEQGRAAEMAVEAVNRRGRAITVRVAATPLAAQGAGPDHGGAIIVMEADAALDAAADPV
ncbi:chemotaxis protein CheR [Actinoplanes sp. ATCC 53533]|uniref:CheR family methyltransferase n=1 Tax=Actinoplanes sp. ATCC 53533 TaxID=1288362 RepID=UPI000F7A24BE|nr:CheR family methyltransferase [Actinoplanes sp. ATCC 53533]RSM55758.1 chemotaxis protein CheR [Actinoplanes sp. ATCC 53533]